MPRITKNGVRKYTPCNTTFYSEKTLFSVGITLTKIRVVSNSHHLTNLNDAYIRHRYETVVQLTGDLFDRPTKASGILYDKYNYIFVGYKSANRVFSEMTVYVNGRKTNYVNQ